ncbi:MAG: class I SAM-dependent methyltransferase [Nitrospira sp.]|nr:class I SAM-dependent methyltransferase [Nitrospira sp.]
MYATYIFPRLMDWVLRGERFQTERRHLLAPAQGVVLEIGFGTGLNLPHYPRTVTALHSVDPAPLLPDRVARRVAQAAFPVHIRHVSAERLPYDDAAFDCAVSTFTLCTIPDPASALRDIRRVLKPNGRFLFLEHGRSDDPVIARWQDRLNPLQNFVACGCNLNRRIDQLVLDASLRLNQLDRYSLPGVPRIGGEMYRGTAYRHEPPGEHARPETALDPDHPRFP